MSYIKTKAERNPNLTFGYLVLFHLVLSVL